MLYAEVEAVAKNGGARYSVSDIGPKDFANGMNYLGQNLTETLFTCIHELPMPLRTPEMLLRSIETLLTNLLHQRFNTPNDPHKILDSLCEHIHMGLNDLSTRS